ncbi:MAG: hypothetical protein IJX37_00150 [Oscillospiraceae bacterium]|nr:hypothetical protein [Oscillospiraceae bacterium]
MLKVEVPKTANNNFKHKNAMRRNTQPWKMPGYYETPGHMAASVHHTESILPASAGNVKNKYIKNKTEYEKSYIDCTKDRKNPLRAAGISVDNKPSP